MSFIAARLFSTPSLKATLEAAVNCSTVFFAVSTAAMMGSLDWDWGTGMWGNKPRITGGLISCCSAAVKWFLCSATFP